ncbi:hypothetical protein E2C01_058165 [Portunus trituberculatus]|uniref:Uncharacterized protein n=1 Tax=Portunus trituberculatus TaxID=210409 RepID=A0A5B7H306_PORTR|nr:hypothetical protein [Portunus trituberculatus]
MVRVEMAVVVMVMVVVTVVAVELHCGMLIEKIVMRVVVLSVMVVKEVEVMVVEVMVVEVVVMVVMVVAATRAACAIPRVPAVDGDWVPRAIAGRHWAAARGGRGAAWHPQQPRPPHN